MTGRRPDSASFLARFGRARSHEADETREVDSSLPRGVVIAGAWSWRLLLIGAALAVLVFIVIQLRLIVIPVLIAVLLSALLVPLSNWLQRHRVPRWAAIALALLAAVIVVVGLLLLISLRVRGESHELRIQTMNAIDSLRTWLQGPPFNLTDKEISAYIEQITDGFQADSNVLIHGALSIGSTIGHVATGLLLTLFSTLFILIDGKGIWAWVVRIFPRNARPAVDGAGRAGWSTLKSFARVQVLVATIDALGIGLGAFFLGLPLALPVAVIVFFGSFVPIVGAVLTGALAVLIALAYKGLVFAIIMLIIVLLVQQLEGHVLQPLIMGSAVKVHPLAVVLVVAAGSLLAGIPGALFAVPIAAVINVMVHYVSGGSWRESPSSRYGATGIVLWQTVPRSRIRRLSK